jgi:hypothetical protein
MTPGQQVFEKLFLRLVVPVVDLEGSLPGQIVWTVNVEACQKLGT